MLHAIPFLAALPTLLPAALFLVPLFWRRQMQMFTIAVPPEFLRSAAAARLRRIYFSVVIALGAGGFAASFIAITRSDLPSLQWLFIAGPLVEVAGLLFAWGWAWDRTVAHRVPHAVARTASLTEKSVGAGWWLSTLSAWLPLAVAAILLRHFWLQIPARFPTHWGIDGAPNGWTTRSTGGVYWPLALAAGMVLLMAVMGWVLARYSTASSTPVLKRMTLNLLRAVCWLMAFLFFGVGLLPLMHSPQKTMLWMIAVMLVATLTLVVYAVVTLVRHQNFEQLQNATPEQAWKWGFFYYNPRDAALFVAKRMGYGFTLNFARPASWLIMAAFAVLAIAPLIFIHASRGH